jgi:hypothetical protein
MQLQSIMFPEEGGGDVVQLVAPGRGEFELECVEI